MRSTKCGYGFIFCALDNLFSSDSDSNFFTYGGIKWKRWSLSKDGFLMLDIRFLLDSSGVFSTFWVLYSEHVLY